MRLGQRAKALPINKYHSIQVSAYRIQEQKIDTPQACQLDMKRAGELSDILVVLIPDPCVL